MSREDRVLVRDGRRHHRPTYSRTELRIGIVVVGLLGLIVGWVAWRGRNPDPALFAAGEDLLEPAAAAPADRGPVPEGLAAPGWTAGAISTFDEDNLYEKINGREGFYKSFGFRRLWFVSLFRSDDPQTVVDIEIYDLGESGNALGAYAGERPQGGRPDVRADGLSHLDRNALCVTRGALYIRAIGSAESAVVREQLDHLRTVMEAEIPGEPLPWAYGLFVGELGLEPGRIAYLAENAFSFGFAKDVYSAQLDDESEMFVVAGDTTAEAETLSSAFNEGFRSYGRAIGESMGVKWTEDRYIRTVAGARSVGTWTVGVRGAPDQDAAEAALQRIEQAVRAFPEGTTN